MKAFLLAAGLGTRLKPLTDTTPKCMLPMGAVPGMRIPLLGIWMDKLAQAGVTDVLVNTHHLAYNVDTYIEFHSRRHRWPERVRIAYEPELLGSAGTLRAHADWVADEEFFLAVNADGLTDYPLANLIAAHQEHVPIATMAVFQSSNPSAGGVAVIDAEGLVTRFTEKPVHSAVTTVNAGMYAFSPAALERITEPDPQDIGRDLLPRLTGQMRVTELGTSYFRDIGTPEDYELAQQEWIANDRNANATPHRTGRWWNGPANLLPS